MNPHDENPNDPTPDPETGAPNDDAATSSTDDGPAHEDRPNEGRRSVTDELKDTARKVWLAGLGALSVAEAEGTRVFNKLVENGEEFERRNRPKVDEMKAKAERVRVKANEKIDALEKRVGSAVSSKLQGAGMAAQEQVDELRARIADLEAALAKMTDGDADADVAATAGEGGAAPSDDDSAPETASAAAAPDAGETSGSDDAPASKTPDSDRPM